MIHKAILILQYFKHFKKHRTYGSIAYDSKQAFQAIRFCCKRIFSTIDRFARSKEAASVFLKKITGFMIGVIGTLLVLMKILRFEIITGAVCCERSGISTNLLYYKAIIISRLKIKSAHRSVQLLFCAPGKMEFV